MFDEFTNLMTEVWQHQPILIVLLAGGFIITALLIIDTHRHRKKIHKHRHKSKHNH
jgi:hypothetical protein